MTEPLPIDEHTIPPMDRRRGVKWWAVPAIIATLCSLAVCLVTLTVLQKDNQSTIDTAATEAARAATVAIQKSQVVGCDRSQVQRAVQRIGSEQATESFSQLIDAYLPLLDCSATYRRSGGESVPLRPALEGCFLRLVRTRYFLSHPITTSPSDLERLCA